MSDASGFAMVARSVLYDTGLSEHARFVWALLVAHADADGACWPSLDRLQALTRRSRPVVIQAIDELVAAGLVERQHTAYQNRYLLRSKASLLRNGTGVKPVDSGQGGRSKASLLAESTGFTTGVKPVYPNDTQGTRTNERQREVRTSPLSEASAAPRELASFDARLRGQAGYAPTAGFYATVTRKYLALDLDEEAEKMVGWLGTKRGRQCSTAFVLKWLGKALADRTVPRNGASKSVLGSTQPGHGDPRWDDLPDWVLRDPVGAPDARP